MRMYFDVNLNATSLMQRTPDCPEFVAYVMTQMGVVYIIVYVHIFFFFFFVGGGGRRI